MAQLVHAFVSSRLDYSDVRWELVSREWVIVFGFPIPGPELFKILHSILETIKNKLLKLGVVFVLCFRLHLEVNI